MPIARRNTSRPRRRGVPLESGPRRLGATAWLAVSALVAWGCGPKPQTPEEVEQDLLNEVGSACGAGCRVAESCSTSWSYSGECAQQCGQTMLNEFGDIVEETPCLSARFDFGDCQGDLTCDEFDALQSDLPNPCAAEDEQVEDLCESP